MAYLKDRDQYYWDPYRQLTEAMYGSGKGKTFSTDGSDYDPKIPKPKLSDARRYLSKHFGIKIKFQVTVVGYMLVYSSSESPISGLTFITDMDSIENVSTTGKTGGVQSDIESKIHALSGYDFSDEARITGIYFRPLD